MKRIQEGEYDFPAKVRLGNRLQLKRSVKSGHRCRPFLVIDYVLLMHIYTT